MQWSYRFVSGLLVLASIVGMTFALYLEHFKGLEPCPLCIFQRVGLMAMGIVALIAFLHNPVSNAFKRVYAFLATLGILWSVGVAIRHVWLQTLPPDQVPSCGPGLNYLLDALPLKTVLQQVLQGSGECAAIHWTFLGQSLPVWSLAYFSLILLVCVWQLLRRYPVIVTKKK
ncbi:MULTISPECIES: disulfide bond formation protein B [Acinetobacter]|uniref:Disulfide bond formation protein B n=1 Tax=Acinetobacter baylyi (strain ATCC 33305 / BD413 / ADP1) TaxID=62977 RepID=DSBB_ACIAD|nr:MULTISPECIES: disulfide bond formation protein B [Acinetobacter]Q6F6X5.1 RecName: Full=Disulfide bond formation protein B; AltName: Full=Disulfide oxidoreductase [Acinetobacter baylyi ADP1]ENV55272.1 disulfide bond formation protein B [Acinetobacter baylyi DSM 14961 = CIP 107474]KAF2370987.1 disulfide bond formation protein B [Acinetobacter baylyi]KAF2374803.1 disulfide bond formation protein B [Acinetobacter baylyi]KAF2379000.1 disulfide bond formation protein B [Acinetobacter baylyi]KAF2